MNMIERQTSPPHLIVLPALCTRRNGHEFHAVTVDISADGLRLRSATLPAIDERLTCNLRSVGVTEVRVAWISACDFIVRVVGRDPSPGEVARRLVALSRQQAAAPKGVRVARRIVPRTTAVQVTLADGTSVTATILNLSASGVALALDTPLTEGQGISVGRRQATVVRQIPQGVGAAFIEPLDGAFGEDVEL